MTPRERARALFRVEPFSGRWLAIGPAPTTVGRMPNIGEFATRQDADDYVDAQVAAIALAIEQDRADAAKETAS